MSRVAAGHFRRKREASLILRGSTSQFRGPSPDLSPAPLLHLPPAAKTFRSVGVDISSRTVQRRSCTGSIFESCPRVSAPSSGLATTLATADKDLVPWLLLMLSLLLSAAIRLTAGSRRSMSRAWDANW